MTRAPQGHPAPPRAPPRHRQGRHRPAPAEIYEKHTLNNPYLIIYKYNKIGGEGAGCVRLILRPR